MDGLKICDSPFWNQSVSWNTTDPYISECFKHLILVIGSCAVLWLVAPFELVKICRYRGSPAPWSTLSISKIVCKVLLLIICLLELIKEAYAFKAHIKTGLDGLIAATSYFITIVLTVVITLLCKNRGLRSSVALPSFWMISTVATIISVYDDIIAFDQNNWVSIVSLVDDSASFVISLVQLILSNMTEKGTNLHGREYTNYCPLDGEPLASRLTFSWLHGLLRKSVEKNLHTDDLIPLCSELRSFAVTNRFSEIWNFSRSFGESSTFLLNENEQLHSGTYTRLQETESHFQERRRSLFLSLLKLSSQYLLIAAFFELLYTVLYFLPVYILSLLLNNTEEPKWHFYVYIAVLFVILLTSTFIDSQRKYYALVSAFKVKTAIMNSVFEKTLVSQQRKNAERYLKEDAENAFQMICLLTEIWGAVIRVLLGLYLLWLLLGSACFVGIGTGSFLIPLAIIFGNAANHFKAKALESKSKWLNLFSECLHGMRSLKFYSWEEIFLKKIKDIRKSEIKELKKTKFLRIMFKLIILCSTSLVSLATFTVFVIMTDSFDMKLIFLSYYLIWLLKSPFTNILRLLAHFAQGLSSINRIQSFLEEKEAQNLPQIDSNLETRIFLQNADFAWPDDKGFQLRNITLNIGGNNLIAIVGEPKSGKSSLLRAILGEMEKLNGTSSIKGEIAFVSENPWIQNASVEENILLGRRKMETYYSNVLGSCDLLQDVENFPQGDETQIGEKGFPLNADQKLKVGLARAVYQNSNIYLIDDLSRYTDDSTAERLFKKVIGHKGILSDKIRIFTTDNPEILSLADHIILLKDGQIVDQGDYEELLNQNEYLVEFLKKDRYLEFPEKRKEKDVCKEKCNQLENYKYRLDSWYCATGLSFKPEDCSSMQGETMSASKAFLRKLLNYTQMNGYVLTIIAIVTAVLAVCCEVSSLSWWAWNTSEHEKKQKMQFDIYIYAGFILSQVLFCMILAIIVTCGNTFAIRKFYNWLFKRIFKAPLETFGSTFVGRVLQSFDTDLQYADEEIPVGIYIWLITIFKAPVLLVAIFIHYPILFLLYLYLILAVYLLQKYYMNIWQQLHHLSASTSYPTFNFAKNVFQGISNIRTSRSNTYFITRFRSKLDTHNKCNFLFLVVSRWLSNSIEIITAIFIAFVASAFIYREGQGSYFTGIALVFSLQVPECLIAIICLSSMLDIDLGCLERFMSLSDLKQEVEFESKLHDKWLKSGSVIIRNLTTSYGDRLYPVLSNINIAIRPGEKVAIVGKEDSGISTILDSLFRIREITEGQIFIDNVDVYDIGLHNLRSNLSIIPQDPLVFDGTLRENLDPDKKFKDDELELAIKTANLDPNFKDLNDALDINISLQEKYRIALARCLLNLSKIVVLEGTENSKCGPAYFQNSTLLSFGNSRILDGYDRIICVSSGEIVEEMSLPK